MVSDIVANGSRKPIFGYHSMVFALVGIGFLGGSCGHHMFMSGMNPTLGSTFMVTHDHLGPVGDQSVQLDGHDVARQPALPRADAERDRFVAMFVIGGLSGVFMAATPVDMPIHDTYFIVAHIHYVLFAAACSGCSGRSPSGTRTCSADDERALGKIHFWLTMIFFNLTFFPMHILGMGGHMRRIYDPTQYNFLKPYQPMNTFITIAAFALFASQLIFALNFILSLKWGRSAADPWETTGWSGRCPRRRRTATGTGPDRVPGPYEYSAPQVAEDYLPQAKKLPPTASRPPRRLRATDAERDSMAHATATVDVMRPRRPPSGASTFTT